MGVSRGRSYVHGVCSPGLLRTGCTSGVVVKAEPEEEALSDIGLRGPRA